MADKKSYQVKKSIYGLETKKVEILSSTLSYKFVLIIGGSCNITIDERVFEGQAEDIIIMRPGKKIYLQTLSKRPLEIFEVAISLQYLNELSTSDTNFVSCLDVMPTSCAFIEAPPETLLLLKNISTTLLNSDCKNNEFAQPLYEKNLLSMFVILLLRSAIRAEAKQKAKKRKHSLVDDLFVYIKLHITEEISLDRLEKEFFVSKYHISREFKKQAGITIHQYIIKNKLELCKKLLEQGNSVIDVYKHCGLGGYNHLFRAFKKEYGITPMEYCKEIKAKMQI